nr:MAG TPA: hypothetical protein [Caudoviricetes sp.]
MALQSSYIKSAAPRCARPEGGKRKNICPYFRARRRESQC